MNKLNSDILLRFNDIPKLFWKEPWNGVGVFDYDTGFCNRLFHWELASHINLNNDNSFLICLETENWPELEYIDLPLTYGYTKKNLGDLLINQYKDSIIHLDKDKIDLLLQSNDNLSKDYNYVSSFGYSHVDDMYKKRTNKLMRPIKSVTLKNKNIESEIKKFTNDLIGIHIRRGYGVKKTQNQIDYLKELKLSVATKDPLLTREFYYDFVDDTKYFEIIDNILKYNSTQKFYLSSDLGLESLVHFTEKYKKNVFTYKNILEKIIYTQVDTTLEKYMYKHQHLINIIDLFTLSYCKLLVRSYGSSWSDFAEQYRNIPTIDISKSNEEIINFINVKSFTNV